MFEKFIEICEQLNVVGKIPTLMGSLGLEFVTKKDWHANDIDIHVEGDERGWEVSDEERIYDFDKITQVMTDLGYTLVDLHEHAFQKEDISVEFGVVNTLARFAGIKFDELNLVQLGNIQFYVPTLSQFLKIYEASSKDSYRNNNNNSKDFEKIIYLKSQIESNE